MGIFGIPKIFPNFVDRESTVYSFSYAKIIKEATALNQQAVSTPVNSKSKNSSTSKGNE